MDEDKQPRLNGKELERDLARFLQNADWMVWTQLPLGSVHYPSSDLGTGIVDVMAVAKSFVNVRVNIYEVKKSRQDYLVDVNRGKYRSYFPFCTQFFFATPAGLVRTADLPEGCGLITLGDHGWHVAKAGPRREFKWTETLLLKLLMRGYEDYFPAMRKLDREYYESFKDVLQIAEAKGSEIARKLRGAERYIQTVEEERQNVEKALGRETGSLESGVWALQSEILGLIKKRTHAKEAVELAKVTMALFDGESLWGRDISQRLREIADALEPKEAGVR